MTKLDSQSLEQPKSVGSRVPRLDGHGKVTGSALYVDDLTVPDMLHGWTVRSTVPHGRVKGITLDPDYDWSDVTVVTAADILDGGGENVVHLIDDDQPCLVNDIIGHVDEAIALVAAPTRVRAREAAAHVLVDVEELPANFDPEASTAMAKVLQLTDGDLEAAFERATLVVEGRYTTGAQEQLYIEVQGMLALPNDDGTMIVKGSLQCPYYVHRAVKRLLGVEDDGVAIVQTVTGGGFGGKEEYPSMIAGHAALLARKSGRPVKLIYDRDEDLRATTKRHPSIVTHRTAIAADGTLLGVEIDVLLDAGAYVTLSPVVLSRAMLHAAGPYRYGAVRVNARAALTNSVPAGAFRGFGAPQVTFAFERHMDHIAKRLGRDPLEFRRTNTLREGDRTPTGQLLDDSVGGELCLERAVEMSNFEERRKADRTVASTSGARRRRGIGLSYFFHGAGFTGNGEAYLKGKVAVELSATESGPGLTIRSASTDIGQGTATIFPQIASDTLGVDISRILMAPPDTSQVPDSGPTVASRTTMVVGKVVQEAAREIRERVTAEYPGADFDTAAAAWLASGRPLSVESTFKSPPNLKWDPETYKGDAYPCFGWACDIVEVEVDLDTAEVFITRFDTAQDAGKIIHPVLAEGQVEGGSLQALGFATMEQVVWRRGGMANDRLTNYIIPTSMDAPEMHVELVEVPYSYGPFGAKGIGEIPMNGGAPAVLAAIEDAIGRPVPDIVPLTPERLLPALEGL
ncbi:MAG: CO/xanthine dehydrogenase Mo-binding subunit [Myxococcota bacterium]|jgi:CO/xanthine dehydrogenase Mo-binding subunit